MRLGIEPGIDPMIAASSERPGPSLHGSARLGFRGRGLWFLGCGANLVPGHSWFAAQHDVAAGERPGVGPIPCRDVERRWIDRHRDDGHRALQACSSEGLGGEPARGEDQAGRPTHPGPVLAGVEAEVAVGNAGKLPERIDDRRHRRGVINVLQGGEGEVDGPEAILDGAGGDVGQAALGTVHDLTRPQSFQDRLEGVEDEPVGIGRRAEVIARARALVVVLTRKATGRSSGVLLKIRPGTFGLIVAWPSFLALRPGPFPRRSGVPEHSRGTPLRQRQRVA